MYKFDYVQSTSYDGSCIFTPGYEQSEESEAKAAQDWSKLSPEFNKEMFLISPQFPFELTIILTKTTDTVISNKLLNMNISSNL